MNASYSVTSLHLFKTPVKNNSYYTVNPSLNILNVFLCAFSSFATMENSGLLLYNGRFNEKHDFIALEIQEGQIVLKYSTGTRLFIRKSAGVY